MLPRQHDGHASRHPLAANEARRGDRVMVVRRRLRAEVQHHALAAQPVAELDVVARGVGEVGVEPGLLAKQQAPLHGHVRRVEEVELGLPVAHLGEVELLAARRRDDVLHERRHGDLRRPLDEAEERVPVVRVARVELEVRLEERWPRDHVVAGEEDDAAAGGGDAAVPRRVRPAMRLGEHAERERRT